MTEQPKHAQADTWGSPAPKQPIGNTTWSSPPAYDEPDDNDTVESLPTPESLSQEVRSLASSHTDFEAQLDDMVRDFKINSHIGAGATEDMRDQVFQTQLTHLGRQENALIANIRKEERKLQGLHASIKVLDSAEDIPTSVYAEAASVLAFVGPQVERVKRADQLAQQLQSIASRGDAAQTLAWRQAAQSWLQSNGHTAGAAAVHRVVYQLGAAFTSDRASDLRRQYTEAQSALSAIRTKIERARQARGLLPDFLQGAFDSLPRDPSDRTTGYE